MNFGLSIGDFITVPTLAWSIYKSCKNSSENFQGLTKDVCQLHTVLMEIDDFLKEEHHLPPDREARLLLLGSGCLDTLKEIEALLEKYESLGTQSQRAWDRMRFGLEDITALRGKLVSQTTMLTALHTSFSMVSVTRLEKKLNKFIDEIRRGKREGSVVSTQTTDSLSLDDQETWRQLRRELQDVGVSTAAINEHQEYIVSWLKEAIADGSLDEVDSQAPTLDLSTTLASTSRTSDGSGGSRDAASFPDGSIWNEEYISAADREYDKREEMHWDLDEEERNDADSALLSSSRRRARKVKRGLSYLLFKLFKSDLQIIQAASDGEADRVQELLTLGVHPDTREKWGWTAMSMAAYGGHEDVARVLLRAGAALDIRDVDGDTPLDLASIRRKTGVVRLIQEELERREAKTPAPAPDAIEKEDVFVKTSVEPPVVKI